MSHFVDIPCIPVIPQYSGVIAMTGCAAYGEILTGGGQQSYDVVQMDLQQCEAYGEVAVKDGQRRYEEIGPSNYNPTQC